MIERRITARLEKFWKHHKGSAKLPPAKAICPGAFPDMWDACSLFKVEQSEDKVVLVYDYIGMRFVTQYGMTLTDRGASVYKYLVKTYDDAIPSFAVETVKAGKPVYKDDVYEMLDSPFEVRWRLGLFPFADKHGKLSHVLCGMRWMAVDKTVRF